MRAISRFTVRTVLPQDLQVLDVLARNLRWSWHHPTVQFFASLDPEAWERVGHDPVALLGEISPSRFEQLAADAGIALQAQQLAEDLEEYLTEDKWYQRAFQVEGKPESIAYFSAEFGVTEVMPQYSGGLGILAVVCQGCWTVSSVLCCFLLFLFLVPHGCWGLVAQG